MEFEGKIRSVEKGELMEWVWKAEVTDGGGIQGKKWGWRVKMEFGKGAERSWGKWNVVRRGDQACEDRRRGRLGEGPERFRAPKRGARRFLHQCLHNQPSEQGKGVCTCGIC